MSSVKRILKNVFSNWVGYAVNLVVAFVISPFVVHSLGDTGYGIWVLVGSLTGYLGIMDLGLRPAIVKFVSRYRELNDSEKVNQVINTILAIFTVVGILVVIASVILSLFADKIFKVPPEYVHQLRILIILVGVNLALSFPFGVFNGVLNAMQRFDVNNVIQISTFLARSLFVVIFLKLGGGLIELGVIVLIVSLVEFLLKARWCFKVLPEMRISLSYASRATFNMIKGFSVYTFLISVALRLTGQSQSLIIGGIISASAITYYSIASTLIEYLSNMITLMSVTVTPVASGFDARLDYDRLRKLLVAGTKYSLVLLLPVAAAYLIVGQKFIELWMGASYGPVSAPVLTILVIAAFGQISQSVAGSIFYGLGKVKVLSYLVIGTAVVTAALTLILAGPYGLVGVAIGTAIPQFLYGTIIHPVYICRTLKLSLFEYFRRSYLYPALAAIPFIAIMFFVKLMTDINSIMIFMGVMGGAFVIHLIISFFTVTDSDHRQIVTEKLRINTLLSRF